MKFSVLVSIYAKEKPEYLNEAFLSIWDYQTLKPDQIVLVKDGPVTQELNHAVHSWQEKIGEALKVVELPGNVGLGAALNEGLKFCNYELVARMDTDDISLPDRFEMQVAFMQKNPDISVSSAWVEEYDEVLFESQGFRKLPVKYEDILSFGKRRNPISHPVAIFRKSAIISVGGYPEFRKSQDYALWSLLLSCGHKMSNIPEVLLKMRSGDGMMSRRGFTYFLHEIKILKYQRSIRFIGWKDFVVNFLIRAAVRLPPLKIKKMIYKFAR